MSHPLSSAEEERWAEALAIERMHGASAHLWVFDRIHELAKAGDLAGVARFMEIIDRLDQLREGGSRH